MDLSEFRSLVSSLNPKCYHRVGRERYYTVERHCFLRYRHPVESGDGEMFLQCILSCRTRSWTGDYHRREHPPFLNVGMVHSGETAIRCGESCFIAKAGDVFFLAPDTEYEVLTPSRSERSAVLISGPLLRAIAAEGGLLCPPVFSLAVPSVLERWFERMDVLLEESFQVSVRREISVLCFEMLQYLRSPERMRTLPDVVNSAVEKFGREYGKALAVEDVAEEVGVSASTLTRLFRRYLGKTPHQYLIGIRMRQAARMLEQHSFSVKEIAERVGYGNSLNFSTEFRKFFGASPKKWRGGGLSGE